MTEYVFDNELFLTENGKPKGKGVWCFGDRNGIVTVVVGTAETPVTYETAMKIAREKLDAVHFPQYKTAYLLPKIHPCDYGALQRLKSMIEEQKQGEKICPRCGHKMNDVLTENALSRYVDLYICYECGEDEGIRSLNSDPVPLKLWAAVRFSQEEKEV